MRTVEKYKVPQIIEHQAGGARVFTILAETTNPINRS